MLCECREASSVTVQGLCLQTSALQRKPHELEFVYSNDGSLKAHCSCKAGNSERCKHLIAMLMFVYRTGLENLEQLTCTDMKQAWGKLRSEPLYEAKELNQLCHVQPLPRMHLAEEEKAAVRKWLMAAIPQSALALHYHGRLHCNPAVEAPVDGATIQEHSLLTHMESDCVRVYRELMFHDVAFGDCTRFKIYKFLEQDLTPPQKEFYRTHVQVTEEQSLRICVETRSQDNTKWQRERKARITGSTCRAYFTYIPKNGRTREDKVATMLGSRFSGNDATMYGKSCEGPALREYTRLTTNNVTKLGLVVNPLVPWLGYSPDGVVFRDGQPNILLEVKSPQQGKTRKAFELVTEKKLAYVKQDGENFVLNRNHAYFSQVQLGMFLLDLDTTHFIVYVCITWAWSSRHCYQKRQHAICNYSAFIIGTNGESEYDFP